MPKQIIGEPRPFPELPISRATRAGGFIFVSGTIGYTDDEGKELKGIEAQTKQTLENVRRVLEKAGASLSDVVYVLFSLRNADDFQKMNKVYETYFDKEYPARNGVIVADFSRPEVLIEIECTAYRP